jgi:hypothetical protein
VHQRSVDRDPSASCVADSATVRQTAVAADEVAAAVAAAGEQPPETTTATFGMRRCTTMATVEPAWNITYRTNRDKSRRYRQTTGDFQTFLLRQETEAVTPRMAAMTSF